MNNEIEDISSPLSSMSIGDVLSGMIQKLDSGNSAVAGRIENIGQSTSSSLARIASSAIANSEASKASTVGKDLLNAFNPIGTGNGSNILTSLFLGPVWKGLFSLFSGGSEAQPVPLTKYTFPEDTRTDLSAGLRSDGKASSIRSDAFGLSQSNPIAQTPINISIQALDARSILDRSDDIASALKQALLSNHEINDNLSEL